MTMTPWRYLWIFTDARGCRFATQANTYADAWARYRACLGGAPRWVELERVPMALPQHRRGRTYH